MNKIINTKYFELIIHVLVWFILFLVPYMLTIRFGRSWQNLLIHSWIPVLFFAIIFYCNYLLLIDYFIFNKKVWLFIIINLILITVFTYAKQQIFINFMPQPKNDTFNTLLQPPPLSYFIYIDFITYTIPVVFALAVSAGKRLLHIQFEKKQAANMKLQSELQNLKYQIRPHFFFNSLHNIYSLVDTSPEKAKQTIHTLSKLMRYLLHDTDNEEVALAEEIDFLMKYIALMEIRLDDKTNISINFPNHVPHINIAPLLFISIVENAFKHGISATKKSNIHFSLTANEQEIIFISENTNFPKPEQDKSGSGIGLENLKKRLELLYPQRYQLINKIENNTYMAVLKIKMY